jgi:hypothetical protein
MVNRIRAVILPQDAQEGTGTEQVFDDSDEAPTQPGGDVPF